MSDDKLQKSESAIEVAGNIGEAITRALPQDETPAQTGKSAVTRWPGILDVCKCGHAYSGHNYSDSLGSKTDPLGFMYECRGEGFSYGRMPDDDRKPLCACKQFEYSAENTPSPKMAPVAPVKIVTNETTCISEFKTTGPHQCPGFIVNAVNERVYCKCSCQGCLSAEREARDLNDGATKSIFAALDRGNTVYTSDLLCITCGELGSDHTACVVVDMTTGKPVVCMCDCKDCKRKWFSDGRPVVRQGKIVRATPESVNRVNKLAELGKSMLGELIDTVTDRLPPAEIFDAVGPGIAFTVEPLNPVLRAEGSRPAGPTFEKLTPEQSSQLFRQGVPAGEYKATVASAKIITDKNGRPQLAIEMKVEGSDEIVTLPVPSVDAEMVKEFVRVLGDDFDKPVVIGPPPSPTACEARAMDGVISVRCILPPDHKGTHIAEALMPNRRRLEWS